MEKEEIYTLEILNKIEENGRVTQPEIARQLGISLGLTNAFIKRIAKKGYIKLTTIPRDRVKYLLTPKGIVEKPRLSFKYFQYSLNFYRNAKAILSRAYRLLHSQGVRNIVFYGTGEVAEIAYILLQQNHMRLVAVVDEKGRERKFLRYKVGSLEELKRYRFDKIIITSFHPSTDIIRKLKKAGIPEDKIFPLDKVTLT